MEVFNSLFESKRKLFTVLVDPDKPEEQELIGLVRMSSECGVDCFFVGGSLLTTNNLDKTIRILKSESEIPVILFPGNTLQLSSLADSILFLSLISGRNPEMLIGRHVISAPYIKLSGLEVIPTGYMLIDSGRPTAVSYMSNSAPIPSDKNDIAACTAMAGEMLGLKVIYMDAGSGANFHVPVEMISFVKQSIDIPLIVGGGIRNAEDAARVAAAGADMVVIGNILEKDPKLVVGIASAIKNI
jgi:phosphoglycerol geranylgeranyltransferase